MGEKTVEELKKELLFYQTAFLKIDAVLVEIKRRIGLDQPEMTVNLQVLGVSSG